MSEPKCCWKCGRWGNRAYVWNGEREASECSNDGACNRRADELMARPRLAPRPTRREHIVCDHGWLPGWTT